MSFDVDMEEFVELQRENAKLRALLIELGEIVQYVRDGMCGHISGECIHRTDAALAKFAELNTGAEVPPEPERT